MASASQDGLSRRQLVATVALAGAVPARSAQALPPQTQMDQILSDVDRKFSAEGKVLPFAGNTILCHVPQQGDGFDRFDRLLTIYRELPDHAFSRKLAILPTSSYHMTVLDGANQDNRRKPSWPTLFPRDASLESCSKALIERLRDFRLHCELPLRMIVDEGDRASGPLTLPLRPADEAEEHKLRQLRARLAEALGVQLRQPDSYGFHITIAYRFAEFTPAEEADYRQALSKWKARLAAEIGVLQLRAPEVCTFADMYAYRSYYALAT
jgi:hypothetical protein